MPKGPQQFFICPKCRHTYVDHDPVHDCSQRGYDYWSKEGFRWDLLA